MHLVGNKSSMQPTPLFRYFTELRLLHFTGHPRDPAYQIIL